MPGLSDLLKKIFTGGSAEQMARTPSFVPESKPINGITITPKPSAVSPTVIENNRVVANPYATVATANTGAPSPIPTAPIAMPRIAERNINAEMAKRASDPNTDIRFSSPIEKERFDYVTNNGTEAPHRGFKEFLKNAGTGALMGAAQGGIGGLIGGAISGGVGGAISPTGGKEMRFNAFQLPKLLQQQQQQREQQQFESQQADSQQNRAYKQAQIDDYGSKAADRVADNERLAKAVAIKDAAQRLRDRLATQGKFDKIQTIYNPETDTYDTIGFNPTTGENIKLGENGKLVSQEYLGEKRIEQSNTNNIRTTTTSANNNAATNATRGAIANQANQQKYNSQNQRDAARMAELKAQGKWKDDGGGNSGGRVLNGLQGARKTISADAYAQAVKNEFGGDKAKARAELQRRGYVIK